MNRVWVFKKGNIQRKWSGMEEQEEEEEEKRQIRRRGVGAEHQTAKRKKWEEQMCVTEPTGGTQAERKMESKGLRRQV